MSRSNSLVPVIGAVIVIGLGNASYAKDCPSGYSFIYGKIGHTYSLQGYDERMGSGCYNGEDWHGKVTVYEPILKKKTITKAVKEQFRTKEELDFAVRKRRIQVNKVEKFHNTSYPADSLLLWGTEKRVVDVEVGRKLVGYAGFKDGKLLFTKDADGRNFRVTQDPLIGRGKTKYADSRQFYDYHRGLSRMSRKELVAEGAYQHALVGLWCTGEGVLSAVRAASMALRVPGSFLRDVSGAGTISSIWAIDDELYRGLVNEYEGSSFVNTKVSWNYNIGRMASKFTGETICARSALNAAAVDCAIRDKTAPPSPAVTRNNAKAGISATQGGSGSGTEVSVPSAAAASAAGAGRAYE